MKGRGGITLYQYPHKQVSYVSYWGPGNGYTRPPPTFYVTPPTTVLGYLKHPFLFIYPILGGPEKGPLFLGFVHFLSIVPSGLDCIAFYKKLAFLI